MTTPSPETAQISRLQQALLRARLIFLEEGGTPSLWGHATGNLEKGDLDPCTKPSQQQSA